ncbi:MULTISPECIES: RNA polymerase sigma factor [unclassified Streptomyces]|uniref:RNA polymerase sigma factor n=1 Tax=unclassified Streptomyces TaxID=2593676 RepID=UPI000366C28F|nr:MULTISPECIES: sigma factor-like helix-turn-helix DNA-binding protein [unclassified Streptomyces]EYT81192.1 RNA polymerase subunit sigma-24 [Streptomyces sp. Tu 6176]
MTGSDWAAVRPALRLTYDAFCETHERAWLGVARARLRDESAAQAAVDRMKGRLRRQWPRVLREPVPAFRAWAFVKEEIGAALAERAMTADEQVQVPDWVAVVRKAAQLAEDRAEAQGVHEALYDAIKGLSERRHDVVVLRYLLELPDSVIAEYLDTTEANIRSTASQALARLARALRDQRDQRGQR